MHVVACCEPDPAKLVPLLNQVETALETATEEERDWFISGLTRRWCYYCGSEMPCYCMADD